MHGGSGPIGDATIRDFRGAVNVRLSLHGPDRAQTPVSRAPTYGGGRLTGCRSSRRNSRNTRKFPQGASPARRHDGTGAQRRIHAPSAPSGLPPGARGAAPGGNPGRPILRIRGLRVTLGPHTIQEKHIVKICIFGAGAVGGHLGARLVAAGADEISIVARGPMLAALRSRGLTLRSGGKEICAKPSVVTDDPASLPPQDLVLVTLKAHAVPGAAPAIARLIAPGGSAMFLLNGIPWWWRHGLPGAASTLPLLDPKGDLWNQVRPERTLGCVVHSPNEMVEPGVIVHTGPNFLILGEPDGSTSPRLNEAVAMFGRGGMEARVSADLRRDVLEKLAMNASGNTIAALSLRDLGGQAADEGLCALSERIMGEVLEVAARLGWDLRSKLDLPALARRGKPGMRPSMQQDVTLGRQMEVEALVGQVQAFARELGIGVPAIDVMVPLLRGLNRSLAEARK
jgi:2-dehydropantoate 2-reductase